jgi:NADPH-dependent 2,4-dienoyl-CoA reductase/sulfur reductase-like enzyme/nitrite reductase/ring-hydroxylating ferredoxin subunit
MDDETPAPSGPNFSNGLDLAQLADGEMLLGHVGPEAVLLVRRGEEVFAIGPSCTHYGGPLNEGLLVGDTVRCPWHHACFSLRTGEAVRPPALNQVPCWRVERQGEIVFVREMREPIATPGCTAPLSGSIVILGGGAAGHSAAETLRREGYAGRITLVSADSSVPYDRPNLSKDYLAGTASEDWIPLRTPEFYREHGIALHLNAGAVSIDRAGRRLGLEDGSCYEYDTLLIATGADPVRLPVPGNDLPHVHYLRSFADSRAIIEKATTARSAVVIGASFIGLEVAASLRARGLEVHVVAPEAVPMERVMGREIGSFVRRLHEDHGVHFHLGTTAAAIDQQHVTLSTGEHLSADLVVVGIGVRPALDLAQKAGLKLDRGVAVDRYLRTSDPHIYAAGDLARWPDTHTGESVRVEHWVVAQRQGQTAARNMMGRREPFDAVPFFWSMHYDVTILYVGHAEKWDAIEIDGRVEEKNCRVTYRRDGRILAVATIGRDLESLRAELAFEQRPLSKADASNLGATP